MQDEGLSISGAGTGAMPALSADAPGAGNVPASEAGLKRRPTMVEISDAVSLTLGDHRSAGNKMPGARYRHIAMWIAAQQGYSEQRIGHYYGRDHSTVVYAKKRIEWLRHADPSVQAQIESVLEALRILPRRMVVGTDPWLEALADRIAEKLVARLKQIEVRQ
jgi:hypothetical protein